MWDSFLVAEAPPHLDYPRDYGHAAEMVEAHRLGFKTIPIASRGRGDQGEHIFRRIAQPARDKFMPLLYGDATQGLSII